MIRPLRQRHRRIFIALGMVLPVALVFGLATRRPVPAMAELPAVFMAPSQPFTVKEWERADLYVKSPVKVQLWRDEKTGRLAIRCSAAKDFIRPDLLVYWVARGQTVADTLPGNADLLGVFDSAILPLPDDVTQSGGVLVLYSLADGEIVDVSQPIRPADLTPDGATR